MRHNEDHRAGMHTYTVGFHKYSDLVRLIFLSTSIVISHDNRRGRLSILTHLRIPNNKVLNLEMEIRRKRG